LVASRSRQGKGEGSQEKDQRINEEEWCHFALEAYQPIVAQHGMDRAKQELHRVFERLEQGLAREVQQAHRSASNAKISIIRLNLKSQLDGLRDEVVAELKETRSSSKLALKQAHKQLSTASGLNEEVSDVEEFKAAAQLVLQQTHPGEQYASYAAKLDAFCKEHDFDDDSLHDHDASEDGQVSELQFEVWYGQFLESCVPVSPS